MSTELGSMSTPVTAAAPSRNAGKHRQARAAADVEEGLALDLVGPEELGETFDRALDLRAVEMVHEGRPVPPEGKVGIDVRQRGVGPHQARTPASRRDRVDSSVAASMTVQAIASAPSTTA